MTRGMSPASALREYRLLLAREDLVGKPYAAVLRDELVGRTLLFSRFDKPSQRLLPTDEIDLAAVMLSDLDADTATRRIVADRALKSCD